MLQKNALHDNISSVILIALLILSLLLRLWLIGLPDTQVFDEYYYVPLAESFLRGQSESPLHPPLGPYLISLSMRIFGTDAAGYRVFSAIAGTLALLFTYTMILKLTGKRWQALVGTFLISFDCLHFVMSRLAMLDIFLLLFIMAAMAVFVSDFNATARLTVCGILLGLAALVKWAAIPFLAVLTLFSAWSEARRPSTKSLVRGIARALLIPLFSSIIYVSFYCALLHAHSPGEFFSAQRSMLSYHLQHVENREQIASPWWSWLVLQEPLRVYERRFTSHGETVASKEVQVRGTRPFWYMALFGFFLVAFNACRRRDYSSALMVSLFLSLLVPWAFVKRPAYLFYCLPLLPFMAYFTVSALRCVSDDRGGRIAIALYCIVTAISFAMYYPALTAADLQPPLLN